MAVATARQRAEELASTLPPLLVAADRVATTVAQGVHGRRRVGSGESFWQFRRYQPGDAASVIDWRQSGKSDRLFVRQHEWEAAQSVWLWRDSSPSMHYRSRFADITKADRATLLLLATAALLVRGGERIALLGHGHRPATGGAALEHIANAVSGKNNDPGLSLPPQERLPRNAEVVLIGDFLSPMSELEPIVGHFAARGVSGHLLQVLDPAEEDLPFTGRAKFIGSEGEGTVVVGRVEALRESYDHRLRAQREGLGQLSRSARWTFTTNRTDRPPQAPLLALYESLATVIA